MRKNLSLLKPQIQTLLLKNQISENVTYLEIPEEVTKKTMKSDIKLGAEQFTELEGLIEKEHEPRYILITAENVEQGYMAVTYLQAAFNDKHGISKDDCMDEYNEADDNEENWYENPFQVPVIQEGDLKHSVSSWNNPYAMGNMFMQGNQSGLNQKPYWAYCKRQAVCVLCKTLTGFEAGFSVFGEDDLLYDGLGFFQNNDKVYILNIQKDEYRDEPEEDSFEDVFWSGNDSRGKWNYIVLSYAADEVAIKLNEKTQKNYYKMVIKSVIKKKGLTIQRGFSAERLANLVMGMKEEDKCKLIESIVAYAIKDKKDGESEISNKDFAFMDRFVKIKAHKAEEKRESGAKETLLNNLVGLSDVKEQVFDVINVMKYNRMRSEMKISGSSYHNVHIMLGAPGTAKTTVAKLMGQMMLEEKLLPDNRFTCVNGAELKGMYVGHSAPKTKALFENNDIIVIDEAYSLVGENGENDSFSKEAIAQLIIELENHAMDKLVIFAGYGGNKVTEKNNKMKAFLDANPGIKSRINSTIFFDSYTPEEMVEIFFQIAKNQNYVVEDSVKPMIKKHFELRMLDENFGNGREARSLLETTVIFAAKRVFEKKKKCYTKADMQTLTYADVEQAIRKVQAADKVQTVGVKRAAVGFTRGIAEGTIRKCS